MTTQSGKRQVYMDYASTTPIAPDVLEAMLPYLKDIYGNPSVAHPMGHTARSGIEQARRAVKECLRGEEGNVFFTSGGTEANNWAIEGAVRAHNIKHVITSPLEHSSVLSMIRLLEKRGMIACHYVGLQADGAIDYASLALLLTHYPKALVSLMHGNNEVGNLTDIAQVSSLCKAHGAIFHCDMVQTIGYETIKLDRWGIDLCTGSAHKIYGPKGVGFLYSREGLKITPLLHGGQQERGMRGGTENVAGIVGLACALRRMCAQKHKQHLNEVKQYLLQQLARTIPDVIFHGQCADAKNSLCSIVNIGLPLIEKETFILQLAMEGISASAGSACMSGSKTGSHVLRALGVSEDIATLRLSLGIHTTCEAIDHVVEAIQKINRS